MALLPVKLPSGKKLSLTAGGQNELVKKIVEEFCPRSHPAVSLCTWETPDRSSGTSSGLS